MQRVCNRHTGLLRNVFGELSIDLHICILYKDRGIFKGCMYYYHIHTGSFVVPIVGMDREVSLEALVWPV